MKWSVIYQNPPGRKNVLGEIEAKTKKAATIKALAIVTEHVPDVDPKDVWVEEPRKAN